MIRTFLSKRVILAALAILGVAAAAALYWFQPWRLVTDSTVADPLSDPSTAVVVAQGSFVTHEHETTGSARIVRTADGSHQLELAGRATSDGPDLRAWLSDQSVRTGSAGGPP